MPTVNVRYIVDDVDAAVAFYTTQLGFELVMHPAPTFAAVSLGGLRLYLNAPGPGGGGQSLPDGRTPEPGGWNRIQVEVDDLERRIDALRRAGVRTRSDILHGQGGNQIIVEDPSGNPVELFQPH